MNLLLQWAAVQLQPYLSAAMTHDEIAQVLELPPNPELGDAAFPCFSLSRQWKRSPVDIAAELAEHIGAGGPSNVRAAANGPYLNLFFEREEWAPKLLAPLLLAEFGQSQAGAGQRVIIDMSSPNIAKPFGVGHLRSTMIGNALAQLYRASGYEVVTVNHIGDWGTQFGKLLEAYTRWGDEAKLKEEPIRESLRLYVKFHEEAESDPSLEDKARHWFWKLENGDEEAYKLWRHFVSFSMEEFDRVYARLGVQFDHTLGESFYNDKMAAVVSRLQELRLLEESDGAQVVRLEEEGLPPCLILKSDGTTIYPTRDLATALYRKNEMGGDLLLYVVGAEQKLHFQQVFAVLKRMGEEVADECLHLPFGLMKFGGRKMSTRKGQVIFLDEVLDEAVSKAAAIIAEKNPDLADAQDTAEAVGIGAIVFGDLLHHRMLEIDFSLDDALRFEGETGPYVQYTAARAFKLLDKGGLTLADAEARSLSGAVTESGGLGRHLAGAAAWECLKLLAAYPESIANALRQNEPAVVARFLLDAAKRFNRFYHQERILTENREETEARLLLAAAVAGVLRSGLALLGLRTPEQI
ncbi:arginine--tRNA ligase [Paenibacillus montanisoli]|uniref:Arginine--tRNA ligase n=1 Tax=Paenibacillus montanisoli TaxID=2081970 RepID=A0A328TXR1_9BACL|nr:arginine--tRNA ligase [Paenibacillus montanisoli]RAP73475.1 arginine--tRNA ligase [Paenibacillus montanisoli]